MRSLLIALTLVLATPTAALANRGNDVVGPAVPQSYYDRAATHDFRAAQAARGERGEAGQRAVPRLKVTTMISGLDHPWDVQSIGAGRFLVTERDSAHLLMWDGSTHRVRFPSGQVWVSGETGLMSLAIDPEFADTGRFYTCQGGTRAGGGHDVRVVAWTLNAAATRATKVKTLVGGFPTSTGRHGGCRLLITRNGSMLVGTGDAAQAPNPENKMSLGGKTLRLDRFTGQPWPANPFIGSDNKRKRYVHTYGHRNVQGLAERRDGSLWSIEQGTYRDDEVNKLKAGGDYGYNPGPGYDESVPMTDQSLPGKQINARWRSGNPTKATSGGSFVYGKQWGALSGSLVVGVLKDQEALFLQFGPAGKLKKVRVPDALQHSGRLRSVTQIPGGDLLITTDNGYGEDVVLRVHPR
ncbi:PQQ-dependent sugar dehydrogenase [Nocardioides sp. KIGAM211]|uniref:PQQ-dependent sugar dehydrogenase n=1 Tax=Nocardioides luti TaxID=2761101 RepID=A0A7X0RML5_9ACTN|nr:PQQ-dependent sugar dehydrogenase [Nocardioides luti]MBB6629854.1 PQQ-dependent sugar dehydrogenase [Nocardioides luti]